MLITKPLLLGTSALAMAASGVETGVSQDPTTSLTMDEPTTGVADKATFSRNGAITTEPTDEEDTDSDDTGAGGDEGDATDDGDAGDDADGADEPPEDLGEYSDARHDEFDTRYRAEDGSLNEAVLTAEFDANGGKLYEGTYAYFEALGFSRDFVKRQEAALVALRERGDQAIVAAAGGQENLNAAVAWGRKAYTPAQRKAFNKVMKTGTPEQRAEAVELLAARYQKATGKGLLGRRRTTPIASATTGATSTAASGRGFASRAEWLEAREAANKSGKQSEIAKVAAKLRQSNRRAWKG